MVMKFSHYLGETFLCGKGVEVYKENEDFILRPVTIGGRRLCYEIETPNGPAIRKVSDSRMTREQFIAFKDRCHDGVYPGDARIVQRALNTLMPGVFDWD